jgi:ribonuclease HII
MYDLSVKADGYAVVCGVDEAGRGPLAGPVYAAAAILPEEPQIAGLNDSKKLSPKRREALFEQIVEHAVSFCIAEASVEEIDTMNILQASLLAMRRAVEGLDVPPDLVLTDGNQDPGFGLATRTVIGGDGVSASIAAASILAKVARDRYMLELDARYPAYNFAKHKGYGTQLHYEMLELHGPCPEHRKTFLRKWEASREK